MYSTNEAVAVSSGRADCYFLQEGYRFNRDIQFYDDSAAEDKWQREVYAAAVDIAGANGYTRIVDFGTGSGFKLINYFGSEFDTIGYDLPPTVRHLESKYPDRRWATVDFEEFDTIDTDLFIASDVIEHLADPAALLRALKLASFKKVVFSTPARELLVARRDHRPLGPPRNPGHGCEWTTLEFEHFIGEYFEIEDHFISNLQQCTQVIVANSGASGSADDPPTLS